MSAMLIESAMEKYTIWIRRNPGKGHYGWQFSRMPPDDPDCYWWGDYKTAGIARAQAKRAINFPLGLKGERVDAEFEIVMVEST